MDFNALVENVGLPLAALITLTVLGHRRIWVFGWVYRMKEREAEDWKELTLRLLNVSEKVADKVVDE